MNDQKHILDLSNSHKPHLKKSGWPPPKKEIPSAWRAFKCAPRAVDFSVFPGVSLSVFVRVSLAARRRDRPARDAGVPSPPPRRENRARGEKHATPPRGRPERPRRRRRGARAQDARSRASDGRVRRRGREHGGSSRGVARRRVTFPLQNEDALYVARRERMMDGWMDGWMDV